MADKSHPISEERARELASGDYGKECAALILGCTTAIAWNPNPAESSDLIANNGTIFVIDTGKCLLAVTAGHVYSGYRDAMNIYGAKSAIGGLAFDPIDRLIDHCPKADIATFKIKSQEVRKIQSAREDKDNVSPLTQWPPIVPQIGQGIMLAGIPGCEREEVGSNEVIFGTYPVLTTATSVSERQITCHIDRDRAGPLKDRRMPPSDFKTGGMSGGPVLAVRESCGGFVSFPLAGVITQGEGDIFFASRADVIQADGTIKRQYLP